MSNFIIIWKLLVLFEDNENEAQVKDKTGKLQLVIDKTDV